MKNLTDLRLALLQTVEDVRAKTIDAQDAIAISKNAQTIINLTRLELDYFMLSRDSKNPVKFLEAKSSDDDREE